MLFRSRKPVRTRVADFWKWFEEKQERLHRDALDNQRAIRTVQEIENRLRKVVPLSIEISPTDSIVEMTISADGIRNLFPIVALLCNQAPSVKGWRILPLRRSKTFGTLHLQDGSVSMEACKFLAEVTADGKINTTLYIEGLKDSNIEEFMVAGFLILDALLGEFDVATSIGEVAFLPMQDNEGLPLSELKTLVESISKPSNVSISNLWQGDSSYAESYCQEFGRQIELSLVCGPGQEIVTGRLKEISREEETEKSIVGLFSRNQLVFSAVDDCDEENTRVFQGLLKENQILGSCFLNEFEIGSWTVRSLSS